MSAPSTGKINSILEDLAAARKGLLVAAEAIPSGKWKAPPPAGGWSAGEVFAHLAQVENAIVKGAGKAISEPPQPLKFTQRFHVPVWMVEFRLLKRKTPLALDPASVLEMADSLERLAESRRALLALIEENRRRDLSPWHVRHPFLGWLNPYEWFCTVARHEVRHTKQIREIAEALKGAA
jgi:hypothetical protein